MTMGMDIIKIFFLLLLGLPFHSYAVELTCQGVKKEFNESTRFILISTDCPYCHLMLKKPENLEAVLLFKESSAHAIKKYLQKHQLTNQRCLIPKTLRKSFSRLETPKIIEPSLLK